LRIGLKRSTEGASASCGRPFPQATTPGSSRGCVVRLDLQARAAVFRLSLRPTRCERESVDKRTTLSGRSSDPAHNTQSPRHIMPRRMEVAEIVVRRRVIRRARLRSSNSFVAFPSLVAAVWKVPVGIPPNLPRRDSDRRIRRRRLHQCANGFGRRTARSPRPRSLAQG